MAKTKIKLKPDQSAIVFNADGTFDVFLHDQPEDVPASMANLSATFASLALSTTPIEVREAVIAGLGEDDSMMMVGVEELEAPALDNVMGAAALRAMEDALGGASDEEYVKLGGEDAEVIDVDFFEEVDG